MKKTNQPIRGNEGTIFSEEGSHLSFNLEIIW